MMSDVGKVVFGLRCAHDVDDAIEKAKCLAAMINAADEIELHDLRKGITHVWQQAMLGLMALKLTPGSGELAGAAIKRLTAEDMANS